MSLFQYIPSELPHTALICPLPTQGQTRHPTRCGTIIVPTPFHLTLVRLRTPLRECREVILDDGEALLVPSFKLHVGVFIIRGMDTGRFHRHFSLPLERVGLAAEMCIVPRNMGTVLLDMAHDILGIAPRLLTRSTLHRGSTSRRVVVPLATPRAAVLSAPAGCESILGELLDAQRNGLHTASLAGPTRLGQHHLDSRQHRPRRIVARRMCISMLKPQDLGQPRKTNVDALLVRADPGARRLGQGLRVDGLDDGAVLGPVVAEALAAVLAVVVGCVADEHDGAVVVVQRRGSCRWRIGGTDGLRENGGQDGARLGEGDEARVPEVVAVWAAHVVRVGFQVCCFDDAEVVEADLLEEFFAEGTKVFVLFLHGCSLIAGLLLFLLLLLLHGDHVLALEDHDADLRHLLGVERPRFRVDTYDDGVLPQLGEVCWHLANAVEAQTVRENGRGRKFLEETGEFLHAVGRGRGWRCRGCHGGVRGKLHIFSCPFDVANVSSQALLLVRADRGDMRRRCWWRGASQLNGRGRGRMRGG